MIGIFCIISMIFQFCSFRENIINIIVLKEIFPEKLFDIKIFDRNRNLYISNLKYFLISGIFFLIKKDE